MVNPDDLTLRYYPFKAYSLEVVDVPGRGRLVRLQAGRPAAHPVRGHGRGAARRRAPRLSELTNKSKIRKERACLEHTTSLATGSRDSSWIRLKKQRVGYLVDFQGLNMAEFLKQDIEVFTPYNNSETQYGGITIDSDTAKATCTGVIESFAFGGGVGDPICISAYISAENAEVLKAKMKTTLDTTTIKKLRLVDLRISTRKTRSGIEEAYPEGP